MSEGTENKTIQEQFEIFRKEVLLWWDRLCLGSHLELRLELGGLKTENSAAECESLVESHLVFIRLNNELAPEDATDDRLRVYALHEVCHALEFPLSALAIQRCVTERELETASHEVVTRLQHIFSHVAKFDG